MLSFNDLARIQQQTKEEDYWRKKEKEDREAGVVAPAIVAPALPTANANATRFKHVKSRLYNTATVQTAEEKALQSPQGGKSRPSSPHKRTISNQDAQMIARLSRPRHTPDFKRTQSTSDLAKVGAWGSPLASTARPAPMPPAFEPKQPHVSVAHAPTASQLSKVTARSERTRKEVEENQRYRTHIDERLDMDRAERAHAEAQQTFLRTKEFEMFHDLRTRMVDGGRASSSGRGVDGTSPSMSRSKSVPGTARKDRGRTPSPSSTLWTSSSNLSPVTYINPPFDLSRGPPQPITASTKKVRPFEFREIQSERRSRKSAHHEANNWNRSTTDSFDDSIMYEPLPPPSASDLFRATSPGGGVRHRPERFVTCPTSFDLPVNLDPRSLSPRRALLQRIMTRMQWNVEQVRGLETKLAGLRSSSSSPRRRAASAAGGRSRQSNVPNNPNQEVSPSRTPAIRSRSTGRASTGRMTPSATKSTQKKSSTNNHSLTSPNTNTNAHSRHDPNNTSVPSPSSVLGVTGPAAASSSVSESHLRDRMSALEEEQAWLRREEAKLRADHHHQESRRMDRTDSFESNLSYSRIGVGGGDDGYEPSASRGIDSIEAPYDDFDGAGDYVSEYSQSTTRRGHHHGSRNSRLGRHGHTNGANGHLSKFVDDDDYGEFDGRVEMSASQSHMQPPHHGRYHQASPHNDQHLGHTTNEDGPTLELYDPNLRHDLHSFHQHTHRSPTSLPSSSHPPSSHPRRRRRRARDFFISPTQVHLVLDECDADALTTTPMQPTMPETATPNKLQFSWSQPMQQSSTTTPAGPAIPNNETIHAMHQQRQQQSITPDRSTPLNSQPPASISSSIDPPPSDDVPAFDPVSSPSPSLSSSQPSSVLRSSSRVRRVDRRPRAVTFDQSVGDDNENQQQPQQSTEQEQIRNEQERQPSDQQYLSASEEPESDFGPDTLALADEGDKTADPNHDLRAPSSPPVAAPVLAPPPSVLSYPASHRVRISVSCQNLPPSMKPSGTCDPFLLVWMKRSTGSSSSSSSAEFVQVGHTEWLRNTRNPMFQTILEFDHTPLRKQLLKFSLYDLEPSFGETIKASGASFGSSGGILPPDSSRIGQVRLLLDHLILPGSYLADPNSFRGHTGEEVLKQGVGHERQYELQLFDEHHHDYECADSRLSFIYLSTSLETEEELLSTPQVEPSHQVTTSIITAPHAPQAVFAHLRATSLDTRSFYRPPSTPSLSASANGNPAPIDSIPEQRFPPYSHAASPFTSPINHARPLMKNSTYEPQQRAPFEEENDDEEEDQLEPFESEQEEEHSRRRQHPHDVTTTSAPSASSPPPLVSSRSPPFSPDAAVEFVGCDTSISGVDSSVRTPSQSIDRSRTPSHTTNRSLQRMHTSPAQTTPARDTNIVDTPNNQGHSYQNTTSHATPKSKQRTPYVPPTDASDAIRHASSPRGLAVDASAPSSSPLARSSSVLSSASPPARGVLAAMTTGGSSSATPLLRQSTAPVGIHLDRNRRAKDNAGEDMAPLMRTPPRLDTSTPSSPSSARPSVSLLSQPRVQHLLNGVPVSKVSSGIFGTKLQSCTLTLGCIEQRWFVTWSSGSSAKSNDARTLYLDDVTITSGLAGGIFGNDTKLAKKLAEQEHRCFSIINKAVTTTNGDGNTTIASPKGTKKSERTSLDIVCESIADCAMWVATMQAAQREAKYY